VLFGLRIGEPPLAVYYNRIICQALTRFGKTDTLKEDELSKKGAYCMNAKKFLPCFHGILIILFLLAAFAKFRPDDPVLTKAELYTGQQTVLDIDAAHDYVRTNIADKSSFSVEARFFADLKLYADAKAKKAGEKPISRVRKMIGAPNGVATVVPRGTGYLLTALHVVDKTSANEKFLKIKEILEKDNPDMFLETNFIAEYHVIGSDGKSFLAFTVATGKNEELALLRVKNVKKFTAPGVKISKAGEADLSDKAVVMIGDPLGVLGIMMDGRVGNGKWMKDEDGKFMYVVAPIVPGNSGGAVVRLGTMEWTGVVSKVMITPDPASFSSIALFVPNTVMNKFLDRVMPK
jgi:hypothetical protein